MLGTVPSGIHSIHSKKSLRLTGLEIELTVLRGRTRGKVREFETDMNTLLYLKQFTSKDLLRGTGDSAQCYAAAWVGGEFWREWTHVYVRLGPFAVLLKLSQHCELAIPNTK